MKIPTAKIRRAATKRARAIGGPSEVRQDPAPKRLATRSRLPSERQEPPTISEVDLTADTPPEGVRAEEAVRSLVPAEAAPMESEGGPDEGLGAELAPTGSERGLGEGQRTGLPPAESEQGPSEGPRTAASPPEVTAGASGSVPAEPEGSEAAEGGKATPAPRGFSLMNDGRRAERLMSEVVQPEFVEELRNTGAGRFYREAYAGLVRVTNSLATTRIVLDEWDATIRQVRGEADEALARAEVAEKALESARTSHAEELKRALESAKADQAAELRRAEDRVEVEAARARAALNQLTKAEGAVETRDVRISELEADVWAAKEEARRAGDEAEKAQQAEKEAASKAAEAEARIAEVEAAVEGKVTGAVEAFKASDDFTDELAEANADAYLQGFRDAKEKIARELNLPEALGIDLDQGSEGARSSDESAADS